MTRDTRSGSWRRFGTCRVLALLGLLALQACGGGGSGGSSAAPIGASGDGELTVAMRDAAGDFLSYTVDVTSLRLERANGDVVEVVPLETRIDFSEMAELTEFFTVATIPSGIYTRVVMTLDFTDAQIVVQSDSGAELPAAADRFERQSADDAGGRDRTTRHRTGSHRCRYSGRHHSRLRSRCFEHGRSHHESGEGHGAAVPVGDSAAGTGSRSPCTRRARVGRFRREYGHSEGAAVPSAPG